LVVPQGPALAKVAGNVVGKLLVGGWRRVRQHLARHGAETGRFTRQWVSGGDGTGLRQARPQHRGQPISGTELHGDILLTGCGKWATGTYSRLPRGGQTAGGIQGDFFSHPCRSPGSKRFVRYSRKGPPKLRTYFFSRYTVFPVPK